MTESQATPKDQQGLPKTAPIEAPEVTVKATPTKEGSKNPDHVKKVEGAVKEVVEKAITKATPGGAHEQQRAAERAAQEEAPKINPKSIEKIEIQVAGTQGGKSILPKTITVTPKEGDVSTAQPPKKT